jgi:hypothetical protein
VVQIPSSALYVAPGGSDSDPGTAERPWRTLEKANASARPGDVVVVRAGTYGARGTVTRLTNSGTGVAPITYVGDPAGSKPVVLGQLRITGDNVKVSGFVFEGPTGPIADGTASSRGGEDVQVWIMGDSVELARSEIRGNRWHAGLYLYQAEHARVVRNYIHDNGQFGDPAHANLDHGVYWDSGSGVLANNVVEHNYAYGVQLYPDVHDVVASHNTLVRNGQGGAIVAERAANNVLANNVIANNARQGIRTWNLTGSGNRAVANVLWSNGSENFSGTGLALEGNLVADPRFGGASDYHLLSGSPAIGRANPAYSVTDDYEGRLRAAPADAGAYEAK